MQFPLSNDMLLVRDSIVDISIPSSISLLTSLFAHSVIQDLVTNCNIPNFQFGMLYIGHSCIGYFICISFRDPRNSKQLKDPQRELGISWFSYLNFIKYRNKDQLFYYFALGIKIYERR